MWGISGDIGMQGQQFADKELEKQLVQQQMQERIRQFNAQQELSQQRIGIDREQIAQRDRENQTEQDWRQRQADIQAAAVRERSNRDGAEDMERQAAIMTPPPEKKHLIRVKGPSGGPMARLAGESELASGIEEYQEPKAAPRQEKPERDPVADYRAKKQIDAEFTPTPKAGDEAPRSALAIEHSQSVISKVDSLLPRIGITTAGPVGGLLSRVGGTPASDVRADLSSLAANLAFDQLQKMRDASKTGGALGQVSDRESELLQSVVASIRQDQSPGNLKRNLTEIKGSAQRFLDASKQSGGIEPMEPARSHGGGGGEVVYVRGPNGKLVRQP